MSISDSTRREVCDEVTSCEQCSHETSLGDLSADSIDYSLADSDEMKGLIRKSVCDYFFCKREYEVDGCKNDESLSFKKGYLIGLLTACKIDLFEGADVVVLRYKSTQETYMRLTESECLSSRSDDLDAMSEMLC